MSMNVNITTTRTAYEFNVVDGNYEYAGTYQAGDSAGMSREAYGSVTFVNNGDASTESMNAYIGNFNFNRLSTSSADRQSSINISCNVEEPHFAQVYAAIPGVIDAIEAQIVQ